MTNRRKRNIKYRLEQIVWSLGFFLLCFIPTWLYLVARFVTKPEGFWQEFALGAVGLYLTGGLQIIGLVILGVLLWAIWD